MQRLIPACGPRGAAGVETGCSQALAEWGIEDKWYQLVTARMQNWSELALQYEGNGASTCN